MIEGEKWKGYQAAKRSDVDDRASALTPHGRKDRASHGKDAIDIDGELATDLLVSRRFERAEQAVASIVDDHIDPTSAPEKHVPTDCLLSLGYSPEAAVIRSEHRVFYEATVGHRDLPNGVILCGMLVWVISLGFEVRQSSLMRAWILS